MKGLSEMFLLSTCVLLLFGSTCSYNILVMLPMPLYSHTNSYLPIFIELARRGNNVTMLSPFPLKEPVPNFNEIVIENTWETIHKYQGPSFDLREFNGFFLRVLGPWKICSFLINYAMDTAELKVFLNDTKSKFDLIITETFFCQEPFIALGHKYGAIQVSIQAVNLPMSLSYLTGNPFNPSYNPSTKFPLSQHMNFWQRSKNTLVNLLELIIQHIGWIYMDYVMRKHFTYAGFDNLPPISDLFRNISLVLLDNHLSSSYPYPHLPNVIEFGGLNIKKEDELPGNLEKFMNESKHGVIYFSWGSHYKTIHMKPHVVNAFMSAFRKLKQRVLMKADQDTLPGKPENVFLAKWLPQASILGHSNIKLFISHGGLHGVSEAIYHGVPILGTALFADQEFNLNMVEEAGFSININIDTITEEILLDSINRLLTNTSYKENALKRSKIMKDRPLNALDNAVYWVEYLLRHNGAPHLRSAAAELYWYQLLLLDVLAVWGSVFLLILILFYKLLRLMHNASKLRKASETLKEKSKSE